MPVQMKRLQIAYKAVDKYACIGEALGYVAFVLIMYLALQNVWASGGTELVSEQGLIFWAVIALLVGLFVGRVLPVIMYSSVNQWYLKARRKF